MSTPLLQVENVKTHFPLTKGVFFQKVTGHVKAVDGISFNLREGEILGLVGESGCGKSTLGRTIMQLLHATEGSVRIGNTDLAKLSPTQLQKARVDFQMIFQDPYASLNPRMTVFDTLAEPLLVHGQTKSSNIDAEVSKLMEMVGLAPRFMRKYPHEFSGGQRQRIAIARAIALRPKLVVADEPVSALDVSIQSQIINLLLKLSKQLNLTMIFISHDLSVVKYIADRIAVMYLGRFVEVGEAEKVIENPLHPYTKALVSAIPHPDPKKERERQRILLEGDPPSPITPPKGCHFHPRCRYAQPVCSDQTPVLEEASKDRQVSCFRYREI